ncbi:MAG: hypothetical protein KDD43_10150 [Bdellovibrionales bacterium]|nr:hypothetical protein [Bdellovibrionales bacterium]
MNSLARAFLVAATLAATGLAMGSVQVVPEKLVKTFDGRKAFCRGKGDVHRKGAFAYQVFGYDAKMIGEKELSVGYSFRPVKCIEKSAGKFGFVAISKSLDTPIEYESITPDGKIQVTSQNQDFHFLLWNPQLGAKDSKLASVSTRPGVQRVYFVLGLEEALTPEAYQAIWVRGEEVKNRMETFLRWTTSAEGSDGTKIHPRTEVGGSYALTMRFYRDQAGVLQVQALK